MAHLLSHALPESPISPMPASPIVRTAYHRRLRNALVRLTMAWTFSFATPGLVSIPHLVEHGPLSTLGDTPYSTMREMITFVILLSWVLITAGGLFTQLELSEHLVHWSGYGRRRRQEHHRWLLVSPPGMSWVLLVPLLFGVSGGLAITTFGSVMRSEFDIAAGAAAGFVLTLFGSIVAGRKAIAATAGAFDVTRRTNQIIAEGQRSIARVESMRSTGEFVLGQAEFEIELASDHGGERSTLTLRALEYPVWAPIPGTEYDVWTMDNRPLDIANADQIVIERRYLGQDLPEDPTIYRYQDGEGIPRLAPRWAGKSLETITRIADEDALSERLVVAIGRTILLGMFVVSFLIVLLQLDGVSKYAVAAWLTMIAFMSAHTAIGWAYRWRARWMVRNGVESGVLGPLGFLMIFLPIPVIVLDYPGIPAVIEDAPVVTAHIATWITVGLFTVIFAFGIGSSGDEPHIFNGELEASMEAIQQALTTHDASSADRLEAETGVRVGVGLLK